MFLGRKCLIIQIVCCFPVTLRLPRRMLYNPPSKLPRKLPDPCGYNLNRPCRAAWRARRTWSTWPVRSQCRPPWSSAWDRNPLPSCIPRPRRCISALPAPASWSPCPARRSRRCTWPCPADRVKDSPGSAKPRGEPARRSPSQAWPARDAGTYLQVEHAGLRSGREVDAVGDLEVGVEL